MYIILYCIVLYCIVLYCIVLYCIVLYGMVWYGIVLYCMVWHGMVWYGTVWYVSTIVIEHGKLDRYRPFMPGSAHLGLGARQCPSTRAATPSICSRSLMW